MSAPTITPVSYSYEGAALATGYSVDVIRRAVRSGDLELRYPRVAGQPVAKPTILRDALEAWVRSGAPARTSA